MSQNNAKYYKKIKDVVKNSYFIGSYQRGYRWDKENVIELLEDIFEGKMLKDCKLEDNDYQDENELVGSIRDITKELSEDYCLQPIVVKKLGDNRYSVIDGQQRLTTLFIILKALCNNSRKNFPDSFSIEYQSREQSAEFLNKINDNSSADNIDAAYIKQTYDCTVEWLKEQDKEFREYLENKEENNAVLNPAFASYLYGIITDKTKFIWDEVDDNLNETEQKIFADRNTGKIGLTDSELIKSIFMNPEYYGKNREDIHDRQTLISELWDIYENELHKDDFWAFFPIENDKKKEYEKRTRIDALFYVFMCSKKRPVKKEENGLFKAVQLWIDEEQKQLNNCGINEASADVMHRCWREICDMIDGIKELYENNEIYNLLYLYKLICSDSPLSIYIDVLNISKSQRANIIKKEIKNILFKEAVSSEIKKVRYCGNSGHKIKNILIAHNIAIMNSAKIIERFAFKYFDDNEDNDSVYYRNIRNEKDDDKDQYKWEREHIYATNESYIEKAPLDEKIRVLEVLGGEESYKEYVYFLYDLVEKDKNTDTETNTLECEWKDNNQALSYMDYCWNKAGKKEVKYFDMWRCLKVKELAKDLLKRINIMKDIDIVLDEDDEERKKERLEAFFHNEDYDDVLRILKGEYLYIDKTFKDTYDKIKQAGTKPDTIMWYGYEFKINKQKFWENMEEEGFYDVIIRPYRKNLLDAIYDNTGISEEITLDRHGDRKDRIVTEYNKVLLLSLLRGTKKRIEGKCSDFFKKIESLDPKNKDKGNQEDYKTFAQFVDDNSMGNMMLLPKNINNEPKYRNAHFDKKRQCITYLNNYFIPVASENVLMGKYNELGNGTRQWLMKERMAYLKDMINTIENYFK